ncbi:hypothetical protein ACX80W_04535 [Arthrobacter sp. TMN-37]
MRPGVWQTAAGAAAIIAGVLVFLPGTDRYNTATYGTAGGDLSQAVVLLGTSAVLLVLGGALLVMGTIRRRAEMNRPRTYANKHEDHSVRSEDRPTNPNDTSLRGYQEGIW